MPRRLAELIQLEEKRRIEDRFLGKNQQIFIFTQPRVRTPKAKSENCNAS
jgi:hypothetical protein